MPNLSFTYRDRFRSLNPFCFAEESASVAPVFGPAENIVSLYHPGFLSNTPLSGHPGSVIPREAPDADTPSPLVYQLALNSVSQDHWMDIRLAAYLDAQQNPPEDIAKLHRMLAMPNVLLEIGCGSCEAAYEIALKNPDWGVIATDKYFWGLSSAGCSHYETVANEWRAKRLRVQQTVPANLVVLRAEAELLHFIPDQSITSVLLINPEPLVGQAFLDLLAEPPAFAKIKSGDRQIVVLPYSREMGLMASGGCEFDHSADWSMGLGFIMASRFKFKKADRLQWGVDLRELSPYSKNSTQTNVYLYGNTLGPLTLSSGSR
ncbi:MAG: hypothetical protein U5R30_13405 [Deltaproteobacteria bacterium]|nr:hypothetical protein [Deltaproteobacteria bacterium]